MFPNRGNRLECTDDDVERESMDLRVVGLHFYRLRRARGKRASRPRTNGRDRRFWPSVTVEDGSPTDQAVKVVRSEHYEIYSTIQDRPDMLSRHGAVHGRSVLGCIGRLAPMVTPTDHPMRCYMFNNRRGVDEFYPAAHGAGFDCLSTDQPGRLHDS